MTIKKTAVFISSRFAEFSQLRQLLADKIREVELHAFELDDNGADNRPPSDYCMGLIKQSEVVVLLLGDSYGPLAERAINSVTRTSNTAPHRTPTATRVCCRS